ncbi:MAG: amidohydrolase [Denitrovibrio sp.]|nr:MAG: amidohydrolase [Denitrovibrio sp.]
MALYLKNAAFIDWQTFKITNTNIKVTDSKIEFVNNVHADGRIIDCKGKFVTKSFACGHHHIYSALARGMPAPKKIPNNFKEILTYVWWAIDKLLDRDMIQASALSSAMYCAKNGVTFVIDHHASPNAVEGSLDIIAEAFDKVGVSHLLCYELSDRDGADKAQAGLAEHERYLSSGRQGHVGLHASFTVGDELLENAVSLAKKYNTGLHIHTAEDKADQDHCIKEHGKYVAERLADFGALDMPQTILVHCVHLNDNEKRIIRQSGHYVVENIESNQNNNVGLQNYASITENVILGTDGMHSDMLRSAKAAFLSGQAIEGISFPEAYNRFRNVHKYISSSGFNNDGDNNLVILDYDSNTELTQDNFLGHFIFGLESRHVDSVISNGELIVHNKKLTRVNEDEILAFSKEMSKKLWAKMEQA